MRRKMIADSSANEVCAVGVEPFLHEEIDLSQVDKAEVDRYLFRVRRPRSCRAHSYHPYRCY